MKRSFVQDAFFWVKILFEKWVFELFSVAFRWEISRTLKWVDLGTTEGISMPSWDPMAEMIPLKTDETIASPHSVYYHNTEAATAEAVRASRRGVAGGGAELQRSLLLHQQYVSLKCSISSWTYREMRGVIIVFDNFALNFVVRVDAVVMGSWWYDFTTFFTLI